MLFLHKPQSVLARRILFQVHLWMGIAAGLYIFVVCVTGSALVFRIDLQRALHPHLFTPSAGAHADAATIMERVRDAYPGDRVSGIDAPTTVRPTYLAYVTRGTRFLTILVDPVTGRVLGELPERSLVRTVQDLHFDLLAGRTGRVVNGVGGGVLLAMCLTGLVIWWPGALNWRRSLTVDFRRSWKRLNWDLHSAVGFWSLALVAMWALTGVYFAFPSAFRGTVNWMSPLSVVRAPNSDPAGKTAEVLPTWRDLLARAQAQLPDQFVARVVVPSSDRAAFHVLFSDVQPTPVGTASLASVYLDQFSGAVLQEPPRGGRSAGDVVMAWVAPLHVGSFGGVGIKIAWAVLGLAPPLLFVTGFLMWWVRVVRPRWLATRSTDATRAQEA
jgi:uncharacterized iron-regulated membrane protein